MADGRLFTDYTANCKLLPPLLGGTWADHDRRVVMRNNGPARIAGDRQQTVTNAGSTGCVDTMLPELSKRVYAWNGPVTERIVEPVGLGTGRLYLPGRMDLLGADPDVVAAATIPSTMLPGTFSATGGSYATPTRYAVLPPVKNRYAAPYGN
jgi:hypothetical protein